MHMTRASTTRRAFSMIEMVMVVVIIGIVAAIAVPRYADSRTGRHLSVAKSTLEKDIQLVKLRARSMAKKHTIYFSPDDDTYMVFEGTDLSSDKVVFARSMSKDPIDVDLSRTNLGASPYVVVSAFGDLNKNLSVGLAYQGTEIVVPFTGRSMASVVVSGTDTVDGVVSDVAAALNNAVSDVIDATGSAVSGASGGLSGLLGGG